MLGSLSSTALASVYGVLRRERPCARNRPNPIASLAPARLSLRAARPHRNPAALMLYVSLPWTVAMEFKVNEPAAAMGRFFPKASTGARQAAFGRRRRRRARLAAAPEPVHRRLAGARTVGERSRHPRKGGNLGVAAFRRGRYAARPHPCPFSRPCPRGAARVRASGPGPAPAVADRLGHDPAAGERARSMIALALAHPVTGRRRRDRHGKTAMLNG